MRICYQTIFIISAVTLLAITTSAQTPPSPVFYKTKNSDEWVRKTLVIQRKYTRVLLVDGSGQPIRKVSAAPLELNQRKTGEQKITRVYPVSAVYKSLQEAADAARGGDLIAVMPGTYAGFVLGDKQDAGANRYIHFKQMGRPAECTI